jgi:regulatory protein
MARYGRSGQGPGESSGWSTRSGSATADPDADTTGWADPDGLTAGRGSAERDPEAMGREICLRMLTTAPRTRAQLADTMRRRGVPDDAVESVLDRFTGAGLIDDAAFAKAWVESRHHGRGLSRRSLSAELRQRGVDGDDITEAVETLDPEQEVATAKQLVERKLAATRGQPADARARKVASMLARKGYSAGLAFRLIREAMELEGVDDALELDEPAED